MDYLFQTPWWLPTIAIGVGGAVLFVGLRTGDKGPVRFGGALLVIGLLIAAISYVVETDLEKAVNCTYRLAKSVNDRDWTTFQSLLDPQTSLYDYGNRDIIVALAKQTTEKFDIKKVWVMNPEAEKRGTIILVTVRIFADIANLPGGPIPSDWQLQWQDFGQGMVLDNIRALSSEVTSEQRIREELNRL